VILVISCLRMLSRIMSTINTYDNGDNNDLVSRISNRSRFQVRLERR